MARYPKPAARGTGSCATKSGDAAQIERSGDRTRAPARSCRRSRTASRQLRLDLSLRPGEAAVPVEHGNREAAQPGTVRHVYRPSTTEASQSIFLHADEPREGGITAR